jgi:uncharacterized membrane protein
MIKSDRSLISLLWTVIAVLVAGFIVGGMLVVKHVSDVEDQNRLVEGANQSLKRQVTQLREAMTASPTPSVPPLPAAPSATSASTPAPTPTPAKKR